MNKDSSISKLTTEHTIAQIISVDHRAGELLESIGLQTDKYSEETLHSACWQYQWSETKVLSCIKKNLTSDYNRNNQHSEQQKVDFGDDLSKWCDYIENHYQEKINEFLDDISREYFQVHNKQYVRLKNIRASFVSLKEKTRYYIYFESKKLFPQFRKLDGRNYTIKEGTYQKVTKGIEIIYEDQNELLHFMQSIRRKSDHFEIPPNVCTTCRTLIVNFKILFLALEKQFQIERETVIPKDHDRLESLEPYK